MLCGIVFHLGNHRVALRQQLVEVFVDVVLSERAAQIFGANRQFLPGFRCMNFQSLDLLYFFSRRFHGSCQEGERPARGRVVPRGDFAPMRSNNAERTLRPLWVISRHVQ